MNTKPKKNSTNLYNNLKVAVITAEPPAGDTGGAERFYLGLIEGLRCIGCNVNSVSVPATETSYDEIINNYKHCSTINFNEYDLIISTKSPTYAINHPCHIMYLVHTVRVFDDMFYESFNNATLEHFLQRAAIHKLDTEAMSNTKAKFAIGHEVANRLYRWRGIKPEVLHPPLELDGFEFNSQGDYFFLPGRLHKWKRVDLVIEAIKSSQQPLKLVIAGTGEAEEELKELAAEDSRIQFLGRVSDDKLIELYANALAIPFVPIREDYGYVTLEAFASGKAVVTCSDSGEPTHFVKHYENGLICNPNPDSLCEALEWFFTHRSETRSMGEKGKELISGMSWPDTATQLIEAALDTSHKPTIDTTNVTVLDMQPITPAIGGGRLRLQGLYHNLGEDLSCQYIGSYDWPGENFRKLHLTSGFEEIIIPLSGEHHAAAQALSAQTGGKAVIDISFSRLGHLSTEYIKNAREAIQSADVVVFSHPWAYPLLNRYLTPNQVIVYDSHNVEGYLRAQLLDKENTVEIDLLRQVAKDEYELGCHADLILACSHEDLMRFNRIYEFPLNKMKVAPNGVMAFTDEPPDRELKLKAKNSLKLEKNTLTGIFIGSQYGPNVDAAKFIIEQLALALPDVKFIIAGGVGSQLISNQKNVLITGSIDEQEKNQWLKAADFAVNPMFSGSGTNIKMFDFMALKLPTVTTDIGARGINTGAKNAMLVCEPNVTAFVTAINQLQDLRLREAIGDEARSCIEEGYAWERISLITGAIFKNRHQLSGQSPPLFSVVIPTYERHQQLDALMKCLKNQIERDFEVIILDQSTVQWENTDKEYGYPVTYYHSSVKGAVRARNTGATLAQGDIIAFTDDDCLPGETWLINARKYFQDPNIVGVEGIITSDHLGDSEWRPVTNVGLEGLGFMTANLMVRSNTFQQLEGFDLQFDKPHFREDTDFGWRMLDVGLVPYAKDVMVFHPAQSRAIERESEVERARFFEKDALLFKKHPKRYHKLFQAERHYELTTGFSQILREGFAKYDIPVPEWMKSYL